MWFTWVSPLISYGARHELHYSDLLKLPADAEPTACVGLLWRNWQQVLKRHSAQVQMCRFVKAGPNPGASVHTGAAAEAT
jgi:hypothetical protein